MTIDSATTPMRVRYVSSTDQTTFTVPFPVYDATDLTVYVDGVLQTYDVTPADATEYSISAFEAASTDIVFGGTGQTVGADVLILNDIPVERNSDFSATGVFPIGAMNLQLDKITAMIREREEETELRVLRLAITDFPEELNALPIKVSRAGYLLGFDTDGQPDTTYSATGLVASATSAALTALAAEIDTGVNAAAGSAAAALASELAAAASETAAAASETAAGLSETAAAASETAAGLSETAAALSETNAAASETAAGLSETNTAASETAAGLSEAAAAASKAAAALSESNAATSETNAATSASNASTSATNAATSETNAGNSETAALAAQTAAELAWDTFDDIYLGSKASDPTLDNDGNALQDGALYWNTTSNKVRVYDLGGTAWGDVVSGLTDIVQDTTPQLGGDLDAQGNNITGLGDVTFKTGAAGGTLRTGTSAADKFQIQAYDVDGAAYVTVMQADAGNSPAMQLFTDLFHFENSVDPTKIVDFDLAGATTSTTMTVAFSQTANITVTFPNVTGTLATVSGNLGTPTALTLTNATGLPIIAGTTGTLTVARGGTGATTLTGILKGNGAGAFTAVTAPAGDLVGTTATQTVTNKRVTPRVNTIASSATPTPAGDTTDQFTVTALAAAAAFAAPTGTPVDGQRLIIRIKDNGTARALTWNAIYRAGTDVALPTTTVLSKTMYLGFIYNSADTKWDLVAFVDNI